MNGELERAHAALAAGNDDEALVLLWKVLEPARLAGDEKTLQDIAALARTIPGRAAEDLVKATGAPLPVPAEPAPADPGEASPRRSAFTRVLWAVVIVLLIAMIGFAYTKGGTEIDQPKAASGRPARIPIDADGLFLVPLARYPQSELTDVGLSVISQVGAVDIRTSIPLGPTTYDSDRQQFVAEDLLRRLTESYSVVEGRRALVVGVTSLDMYARADAAKASVTVARAGDGRYAVISTHAFPDDLEARAAALRKALLAELRLAGLKKPS